MSSIFSIDGGVFSVLSKIFDIIFVSFLFIIFSLGIVTTGPALAALYYTTVKVIRKEHGYIWSEFWKSFKENFVHGLIYTILILVIVALFRFNIMYASQLKSTFGTVLLCVYGVICYVFFCIFAYLFPVLSRFKMTIKQTVKFTLFIAMKHLPTTILLQLILGVIGFILYVIPISLLFVPALGCFVYSFVIERVLKQYLPKLDEDADPEKLEWYYDI